MATINRVMTTTAKHIKKKKKKKKRKRTHRSSEVGVLAHALLLGGVAKVGGANALADDVGVGAGAHVAQPRALADVEQLGADLTDPPHRLDVNKVLLAPHPGVPAQQVMTVAALG